MKNIRILNVKFKNVPLFNEGTFEVNFTATDRVTCEDQVHSVKHAKTQKLLGFVGVNASGKTSTLKLIYLALNTVINLQSLDNCAKNYGAHLLQDGTQMIVCFLYNNTVYELTSTIGRDNSIGKKRTFYFKEEILLEKPLSRVTSKRTLMIFNKDNSAKQTIRTKLIEEQKTMMQDDVSIVYFLLNRNTNIIQQMIFSTNFNFLLATESPSQEELQAFDPNIEWLNVKDNGIDDRVFSVKFKSNDYALEINSPWGLSNTISSGTIKGHNMIVTIKDVLKRGGYLIIDELENHMNKELVKMMMDIFKNPKLNRNGACLLFSTHYVETLDFMDRKDNIYVLRRSIKSPNYLECLNYSNEIKRNDVKKSEVILSNVIKGTAPSYEKIKALEDYLCRKLYPLT